MSRMVRLEVGEAERKGYWVDGYVPRESTLRDLCLRFRPRFTYRPSPTARRDALFYNLADYLFIDAFSEATHRKEISDEEESLLDVFFLRLHSSPFIEHPAVNLATDLRNQTSNYGALVFTYSALHWPNAPKYIDRIVSELCFEEKVARDYENSASFRQLIHYVVNRAIVPYVCPAISAETSFRTMGFIVAGGDPTRRDPGE